MAKKKNEEVIENTSKNGKVITLSNFREEPNQTCGIITTIPGETIVEILEKKEDYYKISYDGKDGYVRSDLITL